MRSMDEILGHSLRPIEPAIHYEDALVWWRDFIPIARASYVAIDAAIENATRVDRLAFAFAGGYASALRHLIPQLSPEEKVALAATENKSAHPRSIQTEYDRTAGVVTGKKTFVTLGQAADRFVVIAKDLRASQGRERPSLVALLIDARAEGLALHSLEESAIVPEIPHAALEMNSVRVRAEDVLEGDGYDRYLKPFRTIEDLHMHAGLLAWLLAIARRAQWSRLIREEMLATMCAVRAISLMDPSSPAVHVAVGGALRQTAAHVAAVESLWGSVERDVRDRWFRDRGLLLVAGHVRAERLEKAWARISG